MFFVHEFLDRSKFNDDNLNKAVYTAALVADGWAGAENLEKQLCDQRTDGRTEGRTDGRTDGLTDGRTDGRTDGKVAYRVACPRLKTTISFCSATEETSKVSKPQRIAITVLNYHFLTLFRSKRVKTRKNQNRFLLSMTFDFEACKRQNYTNAQIISTRSSVPIYDSKSLT